MATANQPLELILTRSLMANLTTPAFLVDREGSLVFFNDAAGELLGLHFEEAGEMGPEEWGTRFEPIGADGAPIPVEELPLSIALGGHPAYSRMRIRATAGGEHEIEVCAFPIVGTGGMRGALAIFWPQEDR